MKPFRTCCKIVAISLCMGGLDMNVIAGQPSLSFELLPENATIWPGQPCVLLATFTNKSDAEVELDLGSDSTAAFTFRIRNQQGEEVAQGSPVPRSGLSRTGRHRLPPSGSFCQRLLLNEWCSTMLPEGSYMVICTLTHPALPALERLCAVTILPQKPEELQQLFTQTANSVLANSTHADKMFAVRMLAYSRSPLALSCLIGILNADRIEDQLKLEAIEGIERIGTTDAAVALVSMVQRNSPYPMLSDSLRQEAIRSVYRLKDKSENPQIVTICGKVILTEKRPVQRRVRD